MAIMAMAAQIWVLIFPFKGFSLLLKSVLVVEIGD